jgi:putative redox protein
VPFDETRAGAPAKTLRDRYTDIEMHFVVEGTQVKEHHVKRAIDLAMEKYCSASAQMGALADIKTRFEIIEV